MIEYLRQEEISNREYAEAQEKTNQSGKKHINIHFPDSECSDENDDGISLHTMSRMSVSSNFSKRGQKNEQSQLLQDSLSSEDEEEEK